jgi:hypothetical protein
MGAWGSDSFDNDDAMNWLAELEAEGLPAVGGAIQAVIELAPEYLEASICSAGLAAAEVIAALRGRPSASLPSEVQSWVGVVASEPGGDPGKKLVDNARRAVDLIATNSELRELWAGSNESEKWRQSVADLQARLV